MRGHQRDRLGDIQCRAAAEADDRVGPMRVERRRPVGHLAAHRIAADVGEHRDLESRAVRPETP